MKSPAESNSRLILLTGATGYVGGRLLQALELAGDRIRCMTRHPESLRHRARERTEIVTGDVLDPASLPASLAGVDTAYYLVHALASANSFELEDRLAARDFAAAALKAGVKRIIYLGGLGAGDGLSAHLRSRQEVGRIFRESGVPTIEFRASIVIGSGSASFEMIRALVEKLPVMITPRWVNTLTQPIAIEDVIAYLTQALEVKCDGSCVFEIGGADRVSYMGLMNEYAKQRRLGRWMIPVPVLSPRLSSLWLGLVTPVYARVGRELVDSLRNETVVKDRAADYYFEISPLGFREALSRALINEDREFAETRWSDAFSTIRALAQRGDADYGRRIVDSRSVRTEFGDAAAFRAIERLGGGNGWYYGNWLWKLRGLLDLFFGGPGVRRGRRDPERLGVGDTVDLWRVEEIQPGRLLRLVAEMRLPGRAWLQFEVEPSGSGSVIRQTAMFDPVGLMGRFYWYLLYPLHQLVFAGMLKGIAESVKESVESHNDKITPTLKTKATASHS
jgi:uncharacterized protein YbjT (DUF2867 family)